MMTISKPEEKLTLYQNKKIVLWGTGTYGKKTLALFQNLGLTVTFFTDNNEMLWGEEIEGIKVISPLTLLEKWESDPHYLVQIACINRPGELVKHQLIAMGVDCFYTVKETFSLFEDDICSRKEVLL